MTFTSRLLVALLAITFAYTTTATAQDTDPTRPHRRGPDRGEPRFGQDDRRPPPPRLGPGGPDRGDKGGPGHPPRPGGRFGHHLRPDFDSLEQRDPEMHELLKQDHDLDQQTHDLARQYRDAPEKERTEIRKQLEEIVNTHFEARQKRRALELERLNKELERLKSAIEQRNTAREAIVGKRVADLVGESGELDF